MKISSIISEYNPFHKGHKYHLEQTKEITGSDFTIVIMSGNFVQRGTPALVDKYARTKQALYNGADLVLELPACFATASAEGFAFGAVSILEKLGVVDSLVFGSESGNIIPLLKVADFLSKEPPEYKEKLHSALKQGISYPKARAGIMSEFFPDLDKDFLSSPNNILGIEYCRALKYFNSSITPMTLTRKDNLYHDNQLSDNGKLSSATAIRTLLLQKTFIDSENPLSQSENNTLLTSDLSDVFHTLSFHMPENSLNILRERWGISAPVSSPDFSILLKYKLLLENRETLINFLDMNSELADRVFNNLNFYTDFDSFCNLLKTKELTYTRIARSLLHVLLDIKKTDYEMFKNGYGRYARILGFRKDSSSLLHEIKQKSSIPLISKLSDSIKSLDPLALSMLEKDLQAAHIYESVVTNKFKSKYHNEFQRQLIII